MRYCPDCGSPIEWRFVEGRDREVCGSCDRIFYRNPVPAVGVVVALDGRVVLVQRRYEPRAGCWGLPAGYMELGETAEAAAARECLEETGLQVQIETLLGVYSFGSGGYSGLVIIYAAIAVGGELVAGDDASAVLVCDPEALPEPIAFRTHVQAIQRWSRWLRREPVRRSDVLIEPEDGVVVRRAQLADAPRVLELLQLVHTPAGSFDHEQVLADALLHDWLDDPDHPLLVAEVDGYVAAFAALAFRRTLTGWRASIDDLAVDEGYRRRGLGAALVEAAVRLAQVRGSSRLHIDTSHGSAEAMSFYRACGFNEGSVASLRMR